MEVLEGVEGGFLHVEATNEGVTIAVAILLEVDIVVATEVEQEAMPLTDCGRGVELGVYWYSRGSDC